MIKRNRIEIIKDILEIIKKNNQIRYTPLLRKSNISSKRFKEYFKELNEKGFIVLTNKDNKKFISLSERGLKFLKKYETIINFIEEFGL